MKRSDTGNGRLYDPVLGRFLNPDNVIQSPDFSQSYNRFTYCFNNPLKYTDPDGELAFLAALAIAWAGNYVIGWLDNVINKKMSPKEAFRNTSFIMGANLSPSDMSKQNNYGFSNPQVDAHNAAKHEEEVSKELDEFVASQSGRGRYKDTWPHTVKEGLNYAVPEGKWGGLFQLAGQLILDTPHSPLYYDVKPGELRQNRAYYNAQLGYYEWSRYQDGIMEISNFANYTYYRGTWRGVYRISTGYYNERGYRLWSY